MPLREPVLEYIRRHGLLKAGDRVGVAVSGGADSVALLRLLLELRSESTRQEYLFSFFTHWLPQLKRIRQVKARAGGNGHG